MNLHLSDRSGLYRKLAARRAVRRERYLFNEILQSGDVSPTLRQEIQAIYTRHTAQLPASTPEIPRQKRGTDADAGHSDRSHHTSRG